MKTASVSLIIPHRNRWKDLKRCLGSLICMNPGPRQVIIIDDASDRYEDLTLQFPLNIEMIRLSRHIGTSAAKNEGARAAKEDYFWFLDSDSEVILPGMLEYGLQQFSNASSLGALGGEGVWDELEDQWKLKIKTLYPNYDTRERLTDRRVSEDYRVEIVSTCNLLTPRLLFKKIGGFNNKLEIGEDKEYCWSLRRNDYILIDSFRFFAAHHASHVAKDLRPTHFFIKNHVNQLSVAVIALPFRKLAILPVIDIISKYARFKEQTAEISRSLSAAHGPQARVMAVRRATPLGRLYLYFIFLCTMPISWFKIFLRLPFLLLRRFGTRRYFNI